MRKKEERERERESVSFGDLILSHTLVAFTF